MRAHTILPKHCVVPSGYEELAENCVQSLRLERINLKKRTPEPEIPVQQGHPFLPSPDPIAPSQRPTPKPTYPPQRL
jgi:hypothetical protein